MKKSIIISISIFVVAVIITIITIFSLRANLKTTYTSANTKDLFISPSGVVSFILDGKNIQYENAEIIEEELSEDEFYKLGKEGGRYRYKVIVYTMQDKVIAYKYTIKQ